MRKNKLYLILALIISVILFTTGALCNQCTAAGTEETAATAEQEPIQEEETAEEAVEEEPTQEEETAEEEPSEEEPAEEESEEESTEEEEEETQTAYEEPTISLEVYEGPLYSSADDVCYWRVKALSQVFLFPLWNLTGMTVMEPGDPGRFRSTWQTLQTATACRLLPPIQRVLPLIP